MKNISGNISTVCAVLLLLVGAVACKKNNYLKDGGVHDPHTSLSTYDYLKANAYQNFDSTILLIDHFGLKDSVNNAGTFFAFTDYTINRLMMDSGYATMQDLYDHVSSRFLTQYMFSSKDITLDDVTTSTVRYVNWASDTVLCGVRKVEQAYQIYLTNSVPSFSYYVLQYVRINGGIDGATGVPANDPVDVYLSCQTTGILTSSGTTLHVLANYATLRKL
jgi:hypothetical protein